MSDLEIRYPEEFDLLPETTAITVNVADTLNAFRDSILNIEEVLGLNVNVGIFTPATSEATVSDRLYRLERGIAERNLVYQEINVSDALSVFLNQDNKPFVRIGKGLPNDLAPVQILGPLTILAPQSSLIETYIQTPIRVDVTSFDLNASCRSIFKGKSNFDQPLLTIEDTNTLTFLKNNSNSLALKIKGNVQIEGKLLAQYSIDHDQLLNIETVPTDETRGSVRHVVQGMYHSHRKGRFDSAKNKWIVDSGTNSLDFGIISHEDLENIGTLPTDGNDFIATPGVAYHVTGGDLHDHSSLGGAQLDHNTFKNINPKISNHVTSGDAHDHVSGRGATLQHSNISGIETTGTAAIHITGGDAHNHEVDEEGIPIAGGAQISHKWLSDITTTGVDAFHVTNGDTHAHTNNGDGGKISHIDLNDIGTYTHAELDSIIQALQTEKHKHINRVDLDTIDQDLSTISSPTFNTVTITGDLIVDGTTTLFNTETVEGYRVVVNNTNVALGANLAGLEIRRGPAKLSYLAVIEEQTAGDGDEVFKIGLSSSLQSVATREDAPINDAFAYWDSVTKKFETVDSPISYNGTILSISKDINFSANFLGGTISNTNLSNCTITNTLTNSGTISGGTISGAALSGCTVSGGTLTGTVLNTGTISGGAITGTNITGGSFSGLTITSGSLTGTLSSTGTISGGTVSGATISGGSFTGAITSTATISGGTVSGVTLSGTISGQPTWASAQTFPAIKVNAAPASFDGPGSIILSSNVLRIGGGTSGWRIDNSSGNQVLGFDGTNLTANDPFNSILVKGYTTLGLDVVTGSVAGTSASLTVSNPAVKVLKLSGNLGTGGTTITINAIVATRIKSIVGHYKLNSDSNYLHLAPRWYLSGANTVVDMSMVGAPTGGTYHLYVYYEA